MLTKIRLLHLEQSDPDLHFCIGITGTVSSFRLIMVLTSKDNATNHL